MSAEKNKPPRLQEQAIAALIAEPTVAAAAEKTGVVEATLHRWLRGPKFRAAYRKARREVLRHAVERLQSATGQAVETLVGVAQGGVRDGDRVRAAALILDHAFRGLALDDD